MAEKTKKQVEVLLVGCQLSGVPEKGLAISRNLGTVDLIWPRAGIARRSASRPFVFRRGKVDFSDEPWAQRVLLREEVDGHAALAVSITEPLTIQRVRAFLRLAAKYALKQGADFVEGAMVGYGDIASAPVDALAALVGEKDAPKIIAQGVLDVPQLPAEGEERLLTVPLYRPKLLKGKIGEITLALRAC